MKVCFDISPALSQRGGIGRYARELALALHGLPQGPELRLFHHDAPIQSVPDALRNAPQAAWKRGGRLWRLAVAFGRGGRPAGLDYDLFHGTDFLLPADERPGVITVHDLSPIRFPEQHTLLHRQFFVQALPRMARRAAGIITVSQWVKDALCEYLSLSPDRVSVVPNGLKHRQFRPWDEDGARRTLKQRLEIDFPYILSVAAFEPRKNLRCLLKAYAQAGRGYAPSGPGRVRGWGGSRKAVESWPEELGLGGRALIVITSRTAFCPPLFGRPAVCLSVAL